MTIEMIEKNATFAILLCATCFGYKPPKIQIVVMEDDEEGLVRAYTRPNTPSLIYASEKWLMNASTSELIGVLCHEGRHLYQFMQLKWFRTHHVKCEINKETYEQWNREIHQKTIVNKKITDDFQWGIEIDAEAFSAAVVKYTLNSSVKLIKEIKFQVEALIPGFETKYHLSTYQFKQ